MSSKISILEKERVKEKVGSFKEENKEFSNFSRKINHKDLEHDKLSKICDVWDKKNEEKYEIKSHVNKESKTCDYCENINEKQSEIENHIESQHKKY
jgi:hypothetical protein